MSFYDDPKKFNDFLTQKGLVDDLYKAIDHRNTETIVTTALEILKKAHKMPNFTKPPKNDSDALTFYELASIASNDCMMAFQCFNKALMFAPKGTDLMTKAYLGRCKLLFKLHAWRACLNDIDIMPSHINLSALKKDCLGLLWLELPKYNDFVYDFFKFNVNKHPSIPCASTDVDIVTEDGLPKVVAAKDISVGSVVAVEEAYVGQLFEDNRLSACYYCHKFTFNLLPCDSCNECLFCSNECKDRSWKEYHSVECHIIFLYYKICPNRKQYDRYAMAIRAAIKLKMSCSWEEFISLSSNMGLNKMRTGTVNEIYDVNNKASILCYNSVKHLESGSLYEGSFVIATIIHYLSDVPSFFPKDDKERQEAIKAFGKVSLNLYVSYQLQVGIINSVKNFTHMQITTEPEENSGFFSFTSKLRHSCDANLFVLGLNMKVALIALKPIKRGEELQISHIGHWYENIYTDNRLMRLFTASEIMCHCEVCKGRWDPRRNLRKMVLNKQQKAAYKKCQSLGINLLNPNHAEENFKTLSHCLSLCSNLTHTKEQYEVFRKFRALFNLFQFAATENVTVINSC